MENTEKSMKEYKRHIKYICGQESREGRQNLKRWWFRTCQTAKRYQGTFFKSMVNPTQKEDTTLMHFIIIKVPTHQMGA